MLKLYRLKNFYGLVSLVTLSVMFGLLTHKSAIQDFIRTTMDFDATSYLSWFSGYAISFVLSFGFYVSSSKIFTWILSAQTPLKAFVFADYYLEGSWVGFMPSGSGMSYIVEKFSQDLEKIKVKGISYRYENGFMQENCQWESTIMDIQYGEEHFYYAYNNTDTPKITPNSSETRDTKDNGTRENLSYQGFARFRLESFAREKGDFLSSIVVRSKPSKVFTIRGSVKDFMNNAPRPDAREIKVSTSKEIDYYDLAKLAYAYQTYVLGKSAFDPESPN